jgi:hypothetical protein
MCCSDRDEILEDFATLRAAVSRILGHSYEALTTPERLNLLEALEFEKRRLPVVEHQLINQTAEQSNAEELGGTLSHVVAERLRIPRGDAARRVAEAADLGPRRALSGEPLPPLLPATAKVQRQGRIGSGHVQVIRRFFQRLPAAVDVGTRQAAEADLAEKATQYRPEQLADYADLLTGYLNPDGDFSDEDRARRRGLTLGRQDADGMSQLRGSLTPEARATVEAVLAKLAAPGMCNPDDEAPTVDGEPPQEAVIRDTRSGAQRNHDGLLAGLRALLASGELGQHHGLPATIIVTTTLKELENGSGKALTAGGTLLPMRDVIRLASHAHHYLVIFDDDKTLGLYHTKRLASPAQRIVLYGKDHGCTRPGCDVPGYWTQVHHVEGWAGTGRTDIDSLTLACGPDNRLVEKGWTTRKRANGDTEWIPPPHLDHGQPRVNNFHHPEKILREDDDP